MRIDDTLLKMIIEKDMIARGLSNYSLSDHILINPSKIELGVNEVAYVAGFSVDADLEFSLSLISATNITNYSQNNCVFAQRSLERKESSSYTSTVISSHIGGIEIEKSETIGQFFLRVIKLEQIPQKEH